MCRHPHNEATDDEKNIDPGRTKFPEAAVEHGCIFMNLHSRVVKHDEKCGNSAKVLNGYDVMMAYACRHVVGLRGGLGGTGELTSAGGTVHCRPHLPD